jgi:hypothetical protein
MPEKAGIKYHILCMEWVKDWKKYVDYDNVIGNKEDTKKGGDEDIVQRFHQQSENPQSTGDKRESEDLYPGIMN